MDSNPTIVTNRFARKRQKHAENWKRNVAKKNSKLLSRHVTGFHRQKILRDTDFRAKDNRMLSLHLRNGRLDADTGPCFDWHD
ncbi:unnamed protein product [Parnassius apollo]|uniref:(apollo) hypothetical protein n=1 Tax=Parnassius apollo TaxID=110799 RepID=A0A8S3WNB6_PARAO|nr:unnamed protein product [Parnassius apollo]